MKGQKLLRKTLLFHKSCRGRPWTGNRPKCHGKTKNKDFHLQNINRLLQLTVHNSFRYTYSAQKNLQQFFYMQKTNTLSGRVENKTQLDDTECFIALMIRSTCFGHYYVHQQELETICVLLPPMVCSAWLLVFGGQMQDSRLCVQKEGFCTSCLLSVRG